MVGRDESSALVVSLVRALRLRPIVRPFWVFAVLLQTACAQSIADSPLSPECARYVAKSRSTQLSWETAVGLLNCREEATEAVAALWRRPPSDSAGLISLITASTGVLDHEILRAVLRTATDLSQSPNVRAAAVVVIGRHVNGRIGAHWLYQWRT